MQGCLGAQLLPCIIGGDASSGAVSHAICPAASLPAQALPMCLQVGPELEIPGYGCEDHFIEHDTVEHSWVRLGEAARCSAAHRVVHQPRRSPLRAAWHLRRPLGAVQRPS